VLVEAQEPGKMRIVLRHDVPPPFGNLGTRSYFTTPSGQRLHLFSKPVGLRIGSEIDLALASRLRRGDLVVVDGRIEIMHVWIECAYNPTVGAVITDWHVVNVIERATMPVD
jgi:hypothetical protein